LRWSKGPCIRWGPDPSRKCVSTFDGGMGAGPFVKYLRMIACKLSIQFMNDIPCQHLHEGSQYLFDDVMQDGILSPAVNGPTTTFVYIKL